MSNVSDCVLVVIRLQQPSVSMWEFCLSSLNVWLWPCLGEVSHQSHTDFVRNGKVCPAMSLQLKASDNICICSVCVFAGFSWGSRQKWSPWPTRTAREPWSSWAPWNLPVVSQYKWRCKSLLCSASTLVLITLKSNAVGYLSLAPSQLLCFRWHPSRLCLWKTELGGTWGLAVVWGVCPWNFSGVQLNLCLTLFFKTFGASSVEGLM